MGKGGSVNLRGKRKQEALCEEEKEQNEVGGGSSKFEYMQCTHACMLMEPNANVVPSPPSSSSF